MSSIEEVEISNRELIELLSCLEEESVDPMTSESLGMEESGIIAEGRYIPEEYLLSTEVDNSTLVNVKTPLLAAFDSTWPRDFLNDFNPVICTLSI